MTTPTLLAIDAGQTTMKVRLASTRGSIDHTFPGIRTHEPLAPQLAAVARAAIAEAGVPIDTVAAGVSGLTNGDAEAADLAALLTGTPVHRAVLAHDSTTSFLGALGDARGAVVAAGTGVVTLAVGCDSLARVDGWGHTMGDAGSGFWIGRHSLSAVMRAYDGRGPETSLTDAVQRRWPVLADAYVQLQAQPDWVRQIASLAQDVAEAAQSGDAVAIGITRAAAAELALSVATGLRRVGADSDPGAAVCTIGGVFRSPVLRAAFTEQLSAEGISAAIVAPRGEGIDGVVAVASLAPAHPFTTLLGVASVSAGT